MIYRIDTERVLEQKTRTRFLTDEQLQRFIKHVYRYAEVYKDRTVGSARYLDWADESGLYSAIIVPTVEA